ncbi:hypothetical protein SDC9_54691 [bioreactor metagenome]|uniref:Uncharacterized protein n=1 Tax=bioreactor metagenome TaxID=1076179 RepID=A0A644WX52_9ZZZZ
MQQLGTGRKPAGDSNLFGRQGILQQGLGAVGSGCANLNAGQHRQQTLGCIFYFLICLGKLQLIHFNIALGDINGFCLSRYVLRRQRKAVAGRNADGVPRLQQICGKR